MGENTSECCHSTISASDASTPEPSPVFQEKTLSLIGVRQHLTGNNISPRGRSQAALLHWCQRIWRSPFPLCVETQCRRTVSCWPLKPDHPKPEKYLPARIQTTPLPQRRGWKTCQQQLCLPPLTNCSFRSIKCQQAFCQTNTARLRPVTCPGEHLPATALRSSGADLGLIPLAYSLYSQFIKFDSQWHWMDVLERLDVAFFSNAVIYICLQRQICVDKEK